MTGLPQRNSGASKMAGHGLDAIDFDQGETAGGATPKHEVANSGIRRGDPPPAPLRPRGNPREETPRERERGTTGGSQAKRDQLIRKEVGDRMENTMESEIIPRLVVSCRSAIPTRSTQPVAADAEAQLALIKEFTDLLLADDTVAAAQKLSALRGKGVSLDELYLELFGPTARYLGYLWEQDICDIVDVTLGVGHLQQFVRDLSKEFQNAQGPRDESRQVLLLPIPGEQHTFGLTLMREFFRRANWRVWGWPLVEEGEMMNLIRHENFALVGISVGGDVSMAGLDALIRDIRRVSRNASLGVMVGGPIFTLRPELAKQVGADATAVDAHQAVVQAESLLRLG